MTNGWLEEGLSSSLRRNLSCQSLGNLDGYGIGCIIRAGGGVDGRPDGTISGARAMVQAVEAW